MDATRIHPSRHASAGPHVADAIAFLAARELPVPEIAEDLNPHTATGDDRDLALIDLTIEARTHGGGRPTEKRLNLAQTEPGFHLPILTPRLFV